MFLGCFWDVFGMFEVLKFRITLADAKCQKTSNSPRVPACRPEQLYFPICSQEPGRMDET